MRKFVKEDRVEFLDNEIQISAFLNSGYEEIIEDEKEFKDKNAAEQIAFVATVETIEELEELKKQTEKATALKAIVAKIAELKG